MLALVNLLKKACLKTVKHVHCSSESTTCNHFSNFLVFSSVTMLCLDFSNRDSAYCIHYSYFSLPS